MTDASNGVLLVHAHPDDECMGTGGLIARSVAEGRRVDLVTCTNGEEGEIHDPDLDPDEARPRLKEIRLRELAASLDALGRGAIRHHLLGYHDSGMMGTESNERPEAFWNVDLEEPIGRVVRIIREARPAALVTYDSNGNYGHPDHINAYRVGVGAWEAAADPARYPEAGEPYAVPKLYEIAFNRDSWFAMMGEMKERGIALPWDFDETLEGAAAGEATEAESGAQPDSWAESFGSPDAEITTRIDVSAYADAKRASMEAHRTQRQDMGWLLELPPDLQERALSPEHFTLTRWRDHEVASDLREDSLWSGL
jgi:N-acetyl-1-D-myo-inositol-2-amino-2-deoxy-alpha-D-glucopyranoside deacetylase